MYNVYAIFTEQHITTARQWKQNRTILAEKPPTTQLL